MNPEYILRTQSNFANNYGVGEVISPGVVLFRAGTEFAREYDITLTEAKALLARKITPKKAN